MNPIIRAKALDGFRKTTGLEAATGVHVNVNQQTAISQTDQPRSFEEALDCVRRDHVQEKRQQDAMLAADPTAGESAKF